MFGRPITVKVEVDSIEELTSIDKTIVPLLRTQKEYRNKSLHIVPSGSEAIANTSWATKEDAESYDGICDAERSIALANVIEGRPLMESFELAAATFQKALAKAA